MTRRLNLSKISDDVIYRLYRECDIQNISYNEFVENSLELMFEKIDEENNQKDPPEPIDIDLESKENQKLLEKFRLEKELKEREINSQEIEIKEVKRDFDYKNYEFREFARKLNEGYTEGTILKVHSINLVEILCRNYGYEVIKVEVVSDIPLKKVRYLKKRLII
jgi:hypothetical protein